MRPSNETIKQAKDYIEHMAGELKQINGKFKVVSAARMQRKLQRSFKKQISWLVDRSQSLSFFNDKSVVRILQRKTTQDEIRKMLDDLPENDIIADAVASGGQTAYLKGAKTAVQQFSMAKVGIDLALINPDAIDYLNAKKTLHLSDYKGSISRTTKRAILKILTGAAESGQSYQDTAKQIMQQGDEGVFSYFRAQMIATNEIGHAYGEGNHEMVDIYKQETGAIIEKCWLTVNDDQVTDECMANQDMGWIGFDEHFDSGDSIAPRSSNPRCRCDCGYRHVDSQGNEL